MNDKKFEALALYYSGKSKSSICKKLSIKNRLLTKWINNDKTCIKDKAIHLYLYGLTKNEICKIIYVNKTLLSQWIYEMYNNISLHALSKEIQLTRKQDGYSYWLDKILNVS